MGKLDSTVRAAVRGAGAAMVLTSATLAAQPREAAVADDGAVAGAAQLRTSKTPAPTISYTPVPPGPVALTLTQQPMASIQIVATNVPVGNSVAITCTASTGFSASVSGSPFSSSGAVAGSLALGCQPNPQGQTNGALNCTETHLPSGVGVARTWNLVCPAGVVPPALTYSVPIWSSHWSLLLFAAVIAALGAGWLRRGRRAG